MADATMLARRQVRLAVVAALEGWLAPLAIGVMVASPGIWPTQQSKLPWVGVRVPDEAKEGKGPNQPAFDTTISLEVEGRISATTDTAAQDAIEGLGYAIEMAILCNVATIQIIQQVVSVNSTIEITADGKQHFGAVKMIWSFQVYEVFDPTITPQGTLDALTSMGIHLDMLAPYDPTGAYTPSTDAPPYTPTTAPRTSGPDGRDEAALDITLPQ